MGLFKNVLKSIVGDESLTIRSVSPTTRPISQTPTVKPNVLTYTQSFSSNRSALVSSPYDLSDIGKAEDTDCFIRQAFEKKEGLMFKEGISFKGSNKSTVRYVKTRFAQIAQATEIPFPLLLKRVARSLIRTSNAFVVKKRDIKASGGRIRQTPEGKEIKPIAGYFSLAPETMKAEVDKETGRIKRWEQCLPDGKKRYFKVGDVAHFAIHKREGFLFGVPTVVPVLDDVRALRQIEENIELLIYQHIFPLFHYKVGTESAPAGYTEEGTLEIDAVKSAVRLMPSEGAIITPERHDIKAIGVEGRALRAESYLTHFKKRVFAGLGVSQVDMGDGDCYDELTQTLTENGWKYHHEIDHSVEKIATYNPETEQIEFHQANYKYEGLYQGDMVCFTGKHLDIKVSPLHEMWVKPKVKLGQDSKPFEKIKAIDILDGNYYSEFYVKGSAAFEENSSVIDQIVIGKTSYDLNNFARFLGYFISEGCLDKYNASKKRYRVSLSQNEGPVLNDMCGLLDSLQFSHNLSFTRGNQGSLKIYGKPLYQWLEERIGHTAAKKNLPQEVFSWTKQARSELFSSLIAGDGTISKLVGRTSQTYYTISKQLADDVQRLAMSLGYAARVKEAQQSKESKNPEGTIWRVYISGSSDGSINHLVTKKNISIEKYEKTIYCYNVPNHLFVTRRNGKVAIQGNTTNRATANTLSRALVDSVKSIQDDLEVQWNHKIINELLLESTFGVDCLEEDNAVHLVFSEIDIQNKMEQEQHAAELFMKNGLTWDEFRGRLGLEPIVVPEAGEDQDSDKYTEWFNTYWKLFEEPLNLIRAVDEPYSIASQAAALARSVGITPEQQQTAQLAKEADQKRESQNAASARQQGTKKTTRDQIQDNMLTEAFIALATDSQNRAIVSLNSEGEVDYDYLEKQAYAWVNHMLPKIQLSLMTEFFNGFNNSTSGTVQDYGVVANAREELRERQEYLLNRLVKDSISLAKSRIDRNLKDDTLSDTEHEIAREMRIAFESVQYRTRFMWDTERKKAKNYGFLAGGKLMGFTQFEFVSHPEGCEACKAIDGKLVDIAGVSIDNIPPLHPSSRMKLRLIKHEE